MSGGEGDRTSVRKHAASVSRWGPDIPEQSHSPFEPEHHCIEKEGRQLCTKQRQPRNPILFLFPHHILSCHVPFQ